MTPFMLGRPLGEPNDPAFQRRVLMQALRLLERTDGPVILEHFPDDNPSWFDRPDWSPAVTLPVPGKPVTSREWEAALRSELALVFPAWERFKARFGRTTVGLAGQPPEAWPARRAVPGWGPADGALTRHAGTGAALPVRRPQGVVLRGGPGGWRAALGSSDRWLVLAANHRGSVADRLARNGDAKRKLRVENRGRAVLRSWAVRAGVIGVPRAHGGRGGSTHGHVAVDTRIRDCLGPNIPTALSRPAVTNRSPAIW